MTGPPVRRRLRFPDVGPGGRRLEELRLTAIEDRIEAELALGDHAALVGELEVLTAEHPFRERFRAQHMLALYRSGRQAEALRAHQKTPPRLLRANRVTHTVPTT